MRLLREYAQKWREMVACVRPLLSDTELVNIVMGTPQGM